MSNCLAPITCANLKPTKSTSYAALLLKALKPSLNAYLIFRCLSVRDLKTNLCHYHHLENPFAWKVQVTKLGYGGYEDSPTPNTGS